MAKQNDLLLNPLESEELQDMQLTASTHKMGLFKVLSIGVFLYTTKGPKLFELKGPLINETGITPEQMTSEFGQYFFTLFDLKAYPEKDLFRNCATFGPLPVKSQSSLEHIIASFQIEAENSMFHYVNNKTPGLISIFIPSALTPLIELVHLQSKLEKLCRHLTHSYEILPKINSFFMENCILIKHLGTDEDQRYKRVSYITFD